MSVVLDGDTIRLSGDCGVEEAELLLSFLLPGSAKSDGERRVDLSAARHLHTSLFQILLSLRPPLAGSSADVFFNNWLLPVLLHPARDGEVLDMAVTMTA